MRGLFAVFWPLALPFAVYSLSFQPTAYYLKIDASTIANSSTFNGNVGLNLTTNTDTSEILLHAKELNVTLVKVTKFSSFKGWVPVDSSFTNNGSILQITFPQALPTSSYHIDITFKGKYRDSMTGFAKVGYSFNKTQRFMGVTRFEPDYASSVFPCLDVPSPRVDFTLEITVSNQTVLSSVTPTIVNKTATTNTYRFDSYEKMAVYQLGWIIIDDDSSFQVLQDNSSRTPVYTRALYPYSNYTSWSTNLTARLLEATEKYTQISLPLPKLEQLVVPEFFIGSAQAWGVISYSEEAFLVEASKPVTSTRVLQQVALVLAHQVVQQWFGNYVTMDSWNNSWLTRGLAEHLKFSIASTIPNVSSWELIDHEVVEVIQPALSMDNKLNEITPLSDLDMYRASALIRMLQDFIGDDLFQTAIKMYLNEKKSSDENNPNDFWNILYNGAMDTGVELAKQSVMNIMKGWSDSAGYPILNVTSNGTHFNISQAEPGRFVPVTNLLQRSHPNVSRDWLQPNSSLVISATGSKWILLNINQTGYYRVNYDQSILNELALDYSLLPRLSRSQLIDDSFAFTLNGDWPITQLLKFLSVLKDESDYFPWYSALKNMQDLIDKMFGHSSHDLLQSFTLDLMSTVISKVGMDKKESESHTDILRRVIILEKACAFGHSKCVQKAVSILKSWMSGLYFDADLNMGLMCSAVSNSSDNIWRELLAMKISAVPTVRPIVLKALSCTRNVQLLNEFLNNITSKTNASLNSKDKNVFLQTLASTSFGADVLLNWLLDKLNSSSQIHNTTITPATTNSTGTAANSTGTAGRVKRVANNSFVEGDSDFNSTEDPAPSSAENNATRRVYESSSEGLSDEEIAQILTLIQNKLTTINQGAKLDNFLASTNVSALSNSTLELVKQITMKIYKHDQWARKYNAAAKNWLESATTTPEVDTDSPPTTSQPAGTTAKPSKAAASSILSSPTLTLLVLVSPFFFTKITSLPLFQYLVM